MFLGLTFNSAVHCVCVCVCVGEDKDEDEGWGRGWWGGRGRVRSRANIWHLMASLSQLWGHLDTVLFVFVSLTLIRGTI